MTTATSALPHYMARQEEWPTLEMARSHAQEIQALSAERLGRPWKACRVIDMGCGSGGLAMALAEQVAYVLGVDENEPVLSHAQQQARQMELRNVEFRHADVTRFEVEPSFDLAVLSTVIEHTPQQAQLLAHALKALRPGGILYLTGPNRLWPIEQHYGLPALHWLPLPLANRYLAMTGKAASFEDACFATTYGGLRRLLDKTGCPYWFKTPANIQSPIYGMGAAGQRWLYRFGIRLIRWNPGFWWIAKGFIVLVQKPRPL